MSRADRIHARRSGEFTRPATRMKVVMGRGSLRLLVKQPVPAHKPSGIWWASHMADLTEKRRRDARKAVRK